MFTINRFIKAGICAGLVATLTGCATDPPDPDLKKSFAPVITHQTQDLNMTCSDLKREIDDTENAIKVLDKQIALHQQQSQSSTWMAAAWGVLGATAPNAASAQIDNAASIMSNADAGSENNQQMTTGQLRVNYNQRHDALIQIYFARKCGVTTTASN